MKTRISVMILMIAVGLLFSAIHLCMPCAAVAEQPSDIIQSTQVSTASTAADSTTTIPVILVEIQNNSEEKKTYTLWQRDHKSGYPGPVSIGGGEIEAGGKHHLDFTYNLGQCYVEWSWPGLRPWEKGKPYKIEFGVGPGQKAIISSDPKEKPIIMRVI